MVEQQIREGGVVSSNPAGRVSREICAKNAATSMETGGRWPVVASPEKKNLLLFLAFFFRIFILPSVNRCRVLFRHSAKPLPSARQKALGKELYAVGGTRQSLCRVFLVLCRVPPALGKAAEPGCATRAATHP